MLASNVVVLAVLCFTIFVANAAARLAFNSDEDDEYMDRRAMLEEALESFLDKRDAAANQIFQFIAQNKNDPGLKNIGQDLAKLGQALDHLFRNGDAASLAEARKDVADFVQNVQKEPALGQFLSQLGANLKS